MDVNNSFNIRVVRRAATHFQSVKIDQAKGKSQMIVCLLTELARAGIRKDI